MFIKVPHPVLALGQPRLWQGYTEQQHDSNMQIALS